MKEMRITNYASGTKPTQTFLLLFLLTYFQLSKHARQSELVLARQAYKTCYQQGEIFGQIFHII
jgi:hypothetical protein